MGTFHILTDVTFVRSYIYQLKPMKVLLYSKADPAPVWVESENYSRTLYLATLSEEIIFS